MIAFNAHYDGKFIVPEQAVDLPRNQLFVVHIETAPGQVETSQSALRWLAENAVEDDLPVDLSSEHDHYLYQTPKRG